MMGECTTVKALAEALRDAREPQDPKQQLIIEILRLMPMYLAIRDLSQWEAALQGVGMSKGVPNVHDEVDQAIDAINDFGGYNLYSLFQPDKTERELEEVIAFLETMGVAYTGPRDVRDW